MTEVESQLETKFSINTLGELRQLLGMEICHTSDSITLTQTQYLTWILERFNMADCNPVHTPMDTHIKLSKLPDNKTYPEIKSIYQNIVGCLIYAATMTRPDIAYTVQTLSQDNINPGPTHLTAAKRVLCYIKGTLTLGIRYIISKYNNDELEIFSDAEWGNCIDDR